MLKRELTRRALALVTLGATVTAAQAAADDDYEERFAERVDRIACEDGKGGPEPLLRVLTLNAAHGRSDGPNQLLLGKDSFKANLEQIGDLLLTTQADIVALQEADGPSWWSGGFDHAHSLAQQADYPFQFRADHATSWLYRYGTAVLSRLPVAASRSHRFPASPPTPRKGFVISEVALPTANEGGQPVGIDVFSVHFDYLSRRAQARQLAELLDVLEDRRNPVIVLGDFNSNWQREDSPVRRLAHRTGLKAWQPDAVHLDTHEGERIDWILISDHFEFHSYRVLTDVVSDHLPVLAEIGINPDRDLGLPCAQATMRP